MAVRRRGSSWLVTVELGRDPISWRRRRAYVTTKTRREAERAEARLRHEKDTGLDVEPTKISVAEYLRRWLDLVHPNLAPTTYDRYESLVRHQLVPHVGSVALAKLRPLHVQHLYSYLQARGRVDGRGGLAAKTVLQVHRVLSKALGQAVKWQLLPRNVCQAVEAPQPSRRELRALSPDEANQLLLVARREETVFADAVIVAVHTGLRMGELLGLRWEDVDLEQSRLTIRRAAQYLPRRGILYREPKTIRSRRIVPLGATSVNALQRARRRQLKERLLVGPAYRDQRLVFSTALGTPIFPGNLRRAFLRIVASSGVGRLRFHDLRHTHASLLLARGVHPKVVSERLGHSGIGITLDVYSHVLPTLQEEAARELDAWLAGRG